MVGGIFAAPRLPGHRGGGGLDDRTAEVVAVSLRRAAVIATLRGGQWYPVKNAPNPPGGLNGISCVSSTMCTAVGTLGFEPNSTSSLSRAPD